jgi:hypothetical protein
MKKFIILLLLFSVGLFTFTSCDDDDNDQMDLVVPTENIVQIAQANGFNSLAAALTPVSIHWQQL